MTPDLDVRPIARGELDLFSRLTYEINHELAGDLDTGHRRVEWLWVALRDGQLAARAGWWAMQDDERPRLLDIFDIADGATAAEQPRALGASLLRQAIATTIPRGEPIPEYARFVPADWRAHAPSRRAVEDRMAAVERTGGRFLVERLRLLWRPGTPVPARSGRLVFDPVDDDGELVEMMAQVLDGTQDAHSRRDLSRMPALAVARRHFDGELARYQSPRRWWQVARLTEGPRVGFVIPADTAYGPIIAYIGVLPGQRGRGYVDELLAEGVRLIVAERDGPIRANTDLANVAMARAFERGGWVDLGHEINMTWPLTTVR